jgi:hypothetical protein
MVGDLQRGAVTLRLPLEGGGWSATDLARPAPRSHQTPTGELSAMALLVGVTGPQSSPDRVRHTSRVCEHIGRRDTQDTVGFACKPAIPERIPSDLIVLRMLAAIDLDHQTALETDEIHNVSANRLLPSKARAVDPAAAEHPPQPTFGIAHVVAQLPCARIGHERGYLTSARQVTPTRHVQRLSSAVAYGDGLVVAELSRGRVALPTQGGGKTRGAGWYHRSWLGRRAQVSGAGSLRLPLEGGGWSATGLARPTLRSRQTATGELSAMALLVGVTGPHIPHVTPTRCVQRLRLALACGSRLVMASLNRGRTALPPPGGGKRAALDNG